MKDKVIDKIIGANMRNYRLAAGLSLMDIGSVLGVTYQQVVKYEQGRNRVAASRLIRFVRHVRIPVEAVFAGIQL